MNQLQKAMSAVRTNPKSSKAWSDLGQALFEQKQIEKAKQSYQRALQLDPENKAAQQGIAMTLMPSPSVFDTEAPPSSKRAAPEKVSPPLEAPPRKVEPQPKAKRQSPRKAVTKSEVEPKPSAKSKLADEENIADEPISLSGRRPTNASAEKEKKIVFHDPPPPPEKPSPGRVWLGIILILLFGFLCVCGPLIFAAYQFMS